MPDAALPAAAAAAAAPIPGAPPAAPRSGAQRIVELKVTGHLMTLDTGLFCIFQPPGSPAAGRDGLPGVRVSAAPAGQDGAVHITSFRDDGWLPGGDDAALVRVAQGPAQILVTVYQAPDAPAEAAPRLQVLRLSAEPAAPPPAARPAERPAPRPATAAPAAAGAEMVAHVQRTGDVGARLGEWLGVRGSKLWIEGFGVAARAPLADSLEYLAVLGRDWLSPWVDGGEYCGSRGMALPLLGLGVRLKGDAALTHACEVTATFVDGTTVGPLAGGEIAQTANMAPLEAFRIDLRPRRDTGPGRTAAAAPAGARAPAPAAAPGRKPARTARRPR